MIQLFKLILAANESRSVALSGEYFELRNAVNPVALVELLDQSGGVLSRLEALEQSDYVRPGPFSTVRVTNGPVAQTVRFFVGSGDAGSRRFSGEVVVIGGVSLVPQIAATLQNNAALAITAAGAAIANAVPARRSVRFTNLGPDPVAIGAPGLLWVNRCVVLNAADSWVEETGANLAWFAITEATRTASVTAQEVIA